MRVGSRLLSWLLLASIACASRTGYAGDTPVMVVAEPEVPASVVERVTKEAARRRPIRKRSALPTVGGTSLVEQALQQRKQAIELALQRAKKQESEAAFGACVREAAAVTSEATEILAETGELGLLRSLHLQTGACMVLSDNAESARLHFRAALLLEEKLPPTGLYRQEVEEVLAASLAEVQARSRGSVAITTDPPGASVWIDGRKQRGVTPLHVDARLGDHYVTLRRFRFESQTLRTVLQPTGRARFTLEAASRRHLGAQLAAVSKKGARRPPTDELRLATARWSRAEELLVISAAGHTGNVRMALLDTDLGDVIRTGVSGDAQRDLGPGVCRVLGEQCEPPSEGVPWWVWPIVGAAVVAGGISIGVVVERERDVAFCPPSGC